MFNFNVSSSLGAHSIAVPGELKALEAAWKKYKSGNVSWNQLVQPTIKIAREGFEVAPSLAYLASVVSCTNKHFLFLKLYEPKITKFPSLASLILPNGKPIQAGDIVKMPKLADTLSLIAENGTDIFYYGSIASQLVAEIQQLGGNITMKDFASYEAIERETVISTYKDLTVIGAAPPISGGACVALALNILENYDFSNREDALQAIVETMKFIFSDRMSLVTGNFGEFSYVKADPAFVNVTTYLNSMLSKEHAKRLFQKISLVIIKILFSRLNFPRIKLTTLTIILTWSIILIQSKIMAPLTFLLSIHNVW